MALAASRVKRLVLDATPDHASPAQETMEELTLGITEPGDAHPCLFAREARRPRRPSFAAPPPGPPRR